MCRGSSLGWGGGRASSIVTSLGDPSRVVRLYIETEGAAQESCSDHCSQKARGRVEGRRGEIGMCSPQAGHIPNHDPLLTKPHLLKALLPPRNSNLFSNMWSLGEDLNCNRRRNLCRSHWCLLRFWSKELERKVYRRIRSICPAPGHDCFD